MSTLTQLEARVSARLIDATNATFALPTLDEALRSALSEYSTALPVGVETVITLPGAGREIALNGLANLVSVLDVWWPYDTLTEVWPPNQVAGFRVWWDMAQPVLLLSSKTANQPQLGDSLRVWYTVPQTIASLDSAAITTVFPSHETGLVTGAAAYAASSETRHQTAAPKGQPAPLNQWAADRFEEFRTWLAAVALNAPASGTPWAEGWGIDKWDTFGRNPRQSRYPSW